MIYLSKGLVCKGSTEELLSITHHGQHFTLPNQLAHIWLNGRYRMNNTGSIQEDNSLCQLIRMGLAEAEEKDSAVSRYRILSRCILYPTTRAPFRLRRMEEMEKVALTWLKKAGLRLSTAELVCLFEKNIWPSDDLLYDQNRQALVEKLYSVDTIADGILEAQMEHAVKRDAVVEIIQNLISRKKVVVL